jgi:hypothetical protein
MRGHSRQIREGRYIALYGFAAPIVFAAEPFYGPKVLRDLRPGKPEPLPRWSSRTKVFGFGAPVCRDCYRAGEAGCAGCVEECAKACRLNRQPTVPHRLQLRAKVRKPAYDAVYNLLESLGFELERRAGDPPVSPLARVVNDWNAPREYRPATADVPAEEQCANAGCTNRKETDRKLCARCHKWPQRHDGQPWPSGGRRPGWLEPLYVGCTSPDIPQRDQKTMETLVRLFLRFAESRRRLDAALADFYQLRERLVADGPLDDEVMRELDAREAELLALDAQLATIEARQASGEIDALERLLAVS